MSWWNDYVGIPFRAAGRSRHGADCAGLVCLVYKEQFNTNVDAHFDRHHMEDPEAAEAVLKEVAQRSFVPTDHPQDGDVVLFWQGGARSHVGIVCCGGKSFLHVQKHARAAIVSLKDANWRDCIDSYWRRGECTQTP